MLRSRRRMAPESLSLKRIYERDLAQGDGCEPAIRSVLGEDST